MSNESDKGTDRRALIAAAAAAGAVAAAGASEAQMAARPRVMAGPPTSIKVDLGGVRLPEKIAVELGERIRRDVLSALAQAGVKGTPVAYGPHPGWYGIIFRPAFQPGAIGPGAVEQP